MSDLIHVARIVWIEDSKHYHHYYVNNKNANWKAYQRLTFFKENEKDLTKKEILDLARIALSWIYDDVIFA